MPFYFEKIDRLNIPICNYRCKDNVLFLVSEEKLGVRVIFKPISQIFLQ